MTTRTMSLDMTPLGVLDVALRNPFDLEAIGHRRELEAEALWPTDSKSWQSWWESLSPEVQSDEAALIAFFVRLADDSKIAAARPVVERRARNLLKQVDSCAEIAARAHRVTSALREIVGHTEAMRAVRETCWASAFGARLDTAIGMAELFQSTPILIEGATGTGKELVAQALCSSMKGKWKAATGWTPAATDSVHLASLAHTLVESTLFGHERAAFTGATKDRTGVFQRCHGGVVFLDEIAELRLETQVALLRVLQEGKARPLGAEKDVEAAPRIVSATHKDLIDLVEQDQFRQDLFYRLSSVVIALPSLVERQEDIQVLAEQEISKRVTPAVRTVLRDKVDHFLKKHPAYQWPGNVRELHAVVRTLALGLQPRLNSIARRERKASMPKSMADGRWTLEAATRWYCQHVVDKTATQTEAAKILDINRGTLRSHLEQAGDEP